MPKLERLRLYRDRKALSQEDLAKASGVARATIARIEAGQEARAMTARKLALALEVLPADLMAPMEIDERKRAA
jgi:transcriptional regulator with XRE-family HTH domain